MSDAIAIPAEKMGRDAARRRVDELQKLLAQVHEGHVRDAEVRKASDSLVPQLQAKIAELEAQLKLGGAEQNVVSLDVGAGPAALSPQTEQNACVAAAISPMTLSRDAARERVIDLEKQLAQTIEAHAPEAEARKASEDRVAWLQTRLAHLETLLRLRPEERLAYLDKKLTASEEMCAQKDASLSDCQNRNAFLEEFVKTVKADKADLSYQIEDLLRDKYDPKSEKLTAAMRKQLGIPEGRKTSTPENQPAASPSDQSGTAPSDKEPEKKATKRKRPANSGGRKPVNGVTSVRVQVVDLPEDQRAGMQWMRNEISQELCFEKAHFYWLKTIRPIYVSPTDRTKPPVIAPLPSQVIPKARVGVSTVVRIIIGKYVNYEPLYRQVEIDKRLGVVLSRAARCRYVEHSAHLLRPIYDLLTFHVHRSFYIIIDETFLKVLDPQRRGAARTAYLWGFYAPHEDVVVMEFSTSRGAEVVLKFLPPDWAGVAHTDGYSAYASAFAQRPRVVHIECMNHLRRYILKAVKAGHKEAIPLLMEVAKLYAIETEARKQGLTPQQLSVLRQAKAKPVLENLKNAFLELKQREEPLLGHLKDAVTYATNRWEHLALYAESGYGYVQIDQTAIERLWRPEKVGLKNYLFIGHPDAGWRSAVIYSVIETCKMVGVDPEEYLLWVLPKLAAIPKLAPSESAIGLLPHDFKKLKEKKAAAVRPRPTPPQHPDTPFCSGRPFSGHRRYRKAHRTRDGSTLAA